MARVKSLRADKSDRLVTRAEVVKAVRFLVQNDPQTIAGIAAIVVKARRPSLWQRVRTFFRQGR